jgi:hypothetical protein
VNGSNISPPRFTRKSTGQDRKRHRLSQIGDRLRSRRDFHSLPYRAIFAAPPHPGRVTTKEKDYNMKSIVLASALVAASAFGALAQTASVPLSSAVQSQILAWIPGADLSSLTTAQHAQILSLFSTSENLRAGENPAGQVKAILNAQ